MAREQVGVRLAYRIGAAGATVRFADGSERTLLPGRRYEFNKPATVLAGDLNEEPGPRAPSKRRKNYADKQRHEYEDKAG